MPSSDRTKDGLGTQRKVTPDELDHTPLTFGAHRGRTPADVAESDPSYILWMYDSIYPHQCSLVLRNDCAKDLGEDIQIASDDDVQDTYDKFNGRRK